MDYEHLYMAPLVCIWRILRLRPLCAILRSSLISFYPRYALALSPGRATRSADLHVIAKANEHLHGSTPQRLKTSVQRSIFRQIASDPLSLWIKAMNFRVFKVVIVQRVQLQGDASTDQIGMTGWM